MPQVYTADFLSENDVLEEQWSGAKFPDAKKLRDKRARELRNNKWTVKVGKCNYPDLGRFIMFWLVATRAKN